MNKDPILIKLGNNIKKLREKVNFSQEDLAFEASLDRTYIGGIERGERNVGIINICKIAKSLNVTPSKLLKNIHLS